MEDTSVSAAHTITFCLNAEKLELSEEKPEFLLNNCGKAPESSGKTRFCVLGELNK